MEAKSSDLWGDVTLSRNGYGKDDDDEDDDDDDNDDDDEDEGGKCQSFYLKRA